MKKVTDFPVPSRDVTSQTLPGGENFNHATARESLVTGIPAGDGKIGNLFSQCSMGSMVVYSVNIY